MIHISILLRILLGLAIIAVTNSETTSTDNNRRRLLEMMPAVDIAVLVDESGSMDTFQAAFQNNVEALFDSMKEQIQGSRAALVGFGAWSNTLHPTKGHILQPLTKKILEYQAAALKLVANGGVEPSCEALIKIAEAKDDELDVGFTPNRDFCIVLITDETSNHDDDEYNETRAIKALTGNNKAKGTGFFFGIMPTGKVQQSFQPLVNATGGFLFNRDDFLASPALTLDHMVTKCNVAVNRFNMQPRTASLAAGQEQEITITAITEENGVAVVDPEEKILVKVLSGDDVGTADVEVETGTNGQVVHKVTRPTKGTNVYQACQGGVCSKNTVTVSWIGTAAPIPENKVIEVGPRRAKLSLGEKHTITTSVFRNVTGTAIAGETVWLKILYGPHMGANMNEKTDAEGEADFNVTGETAGRDIYEACVFEDNDEPVCGEIVSATFVDGPDLVLSPDTATRNTNTTLELTAALSLDGGSIEGRVISFEILSGPHKNRKEDATTNALGQARWFYKGDKDEGTDEVEACNTWSSKCDTSTIVWQFPANVYLNPASAVCAVGEPHILRATVNRVIQGQTVPLVDKLVTFKVISGPNAGQVLPSNKTDASGDAFSRCTGATSTGTSEFQACITDNGGEVICSTSKADWRAPLPAGAPTARCQDITRNALGDCKAPVTAVDVNNGSSDPVDATSDLTLTLNDTSPFDLGDTYVKLIVRNTAGLEDSCNARIRVVDNTAPTINCNSPGTVAPFTYTRTFTAMANDNCPGEVDVEVVSENCYKIFGGVLTYKSTTCTVALTGPSIVIGPSCENGDHVEWEVEARDAAGNLQTKTCAVIFETTRNLESRGPPRHFLRSLA